jgi:galactokinase
MTGTQSLASSELAARFEELFAAPAKIFRAPGRVNLIGEHTDYNDGFVMPCALGFSTRVALSGRSDRQLIIRSEDFPEQFEFNLDHLPQHGSGHWCDYILGVAVTLQNAGYPVLGANMLVRGEVPMGAGLSSSAAVEVASALALMSLNGTTFPMPEVARICQRAENIFVGAKVGIMDQFASCLGKAGHALMLDCRSLDFSYIPLPDSVRIVICNSMVKHEHSGGEYNRRREECDEGVKILKKWYPEIKALRDVSVEQLESHAADLPPVIYKRCLHVVTEDQRVLDSASFLKKGDVKSFGKLMGESHLSMRDLYEISCPEVDTMVEVAQDLPGFSGGRMTGGGFGGCTVNLVKSEEASAFAREIAVRYEKATGLKPDVWICSADNGASAE